MSAGEIVWHTNCDILHEYFRLFGTSNCPQNSICILPNGREVRIGQWLNDQRKYKKGTKGNGLSMERELRLQELVDQGKLQWELHMLQLRDWDFMYGILVEYGRQHGTCNVRQNYKHVMSDGDEVNLGKWLHNQRQIKDTTMNEDHKKKLQALVDQGLFKWRM
eukprot:gene36732-biopygen23192